VRVRFYLRGEGRRATIWWRGEKARDARRDVPLD
jgi:hypothetical protein